MIVSAIVDPSVFGPQGIVDELSRREASALLEGIVQNGVLIDGPERNLLRAAIQQAEQLLSTKKQQRVLLLLQEIIKQHKKYVVPCDRSLWQHGSAGFASQQIGSIVGVLKPDVIVTLPDRAAAMAQAVGRHGGIVPLSELSDSPYEELRRRMSRMELPLDQLTRPEIEERIGRALKFAHVLRIFDYRMVASVQRARRYLQGITFVAKIWEASCVVGEPTSRVIELITVGDTYTQGGFLSGADALNRLQAEIAEPLASSISAQVQVVVKKDNDPSIFHARGFEAKHRAFTLDPGFDAIGTDGPVRRCLLKAELAAEVHFQECRRLPTIP
ncbi:MAG: hypothetical protein KatS3mg105_4940 [Gemmatales bacterium]|nr:MAG: hypothetical protein KatS3mg105_4940 [Gemmatales bacterium]